MPITLTTDFGQSHYVGQVKGAILAEHAQAQIIDVTHGVRPQNVREGAFALFAAAPVFPEGTVHVGIVDPGVGTDRRGVAIRTERAVFVGPDNGLLLPAARRTGIEEVVELTQGKFWRNNVSATFHGRDIFAPVAGHLAAGHCDLDDLGPSLDGSDLVDLDFGTPHVDKGEWRTHVVHIDTFGNAATNLPGTQVLDHAAYGAVAEVIIDGTVHPAGLHVTYGTADQGELLVTVGSSGLLEIAVRQGSAVDRLGLELDQAIRIRFVE